MEVAPQIADDDKIIQQLAHGRLHPFADWQSADVPPVAIGLYTIWKDGQFVYVGMAGKASIEKLLAATKGAGKSGLRNRLRSHASGRRSGDQFCVYVADKLLAAAGHPATDDFVRDYVCRHLSFRYFAFENLTVNEQRVAWRLETRIREGRTTMGKPLLNPK